MNEIEKQIEKLKKGCGEFGCPYTKSNENKIYSKDCVCDNCEDKIRVLKVQLKGYNKAKEEIIKKINKLWTFMEKDVSDKKLTISKEQLLIELIGENSQDISRLKLEMGNEGSSIRSNTHSDTLLKGETKDV